MKTLLVTLSLILAVSTSVKANMPMTVDEMADRCGITEEEFVFLSSVVAAEDSSCFEGQVLVAETVINRAYDSDDFTDTITDVLCQANQFSTVVYSGGYYHSISNRTSSSDQAVMTAFREYESGTAPNVIYFNSVNYCYGTAYAEVGGNYYSIA